MSIYIKNSKTDKLIQRFDEVLSGNFSFTTILGEAGTGKTFLVQNNKEFFETNSHFVQYKSNRHNVNAFHSIEEMLTEITNYIYTLPTDEYKQIKDRLINEHLVHYESLTTINPRFASLISKRLVRRQISISKDNLVSVLTQVLDTLSNVLHPLVLFFDDVQWMDRDSYVLLESLSRSEKNMYFVLAARTTELPQHMINSVFFTPEAIIKLEPFTIDETHNYITKLMDHPQEKMFSETVYILTGGNPFYTGFAISQLQKSNPNTETFSVQDLKSIELTSENPNVLTSQLDRLNKTELNALGILSCLDSGIKEELLQKIGIDKEVLEDLQKKYLVSINNGTVYIVHDIVKYTVYEYLSVEQLENHYFFLLESLLGEGLDNTFYVYLILQSRVSDILGEKAVTYLELVVEEAISAREKGDIGRALELLKFAGRIYEVIDDPSIDYVIKLNTMECEYISENVYYAQALYNELLREYPSRSVETKMNYISFYAYNAEWEKVLSLGNELLIILGHPLTKTSQVLDILAYRRLYSKKSLGQLENLERVKDPYIFDVLEVLTIMIPASNRINLELFNRIALKLAVLVAKHGYSEYSSIGYSMASLIQYFFFKNSNKGDAIQLKTVEILKGNDQLRSIPYALLGTFTHHWNHPFAESMELLRKSYQFSGRDNEFLFSNYALVFHVITMYVNGSRLDEIDAYMNGFNRETSRLEDFLLKHMFELYRTQLNYLRHGKEEYQFLPARKNSFDATIILNHKMLQIHQYYLEDRIEDGFKLADEIDHLVWAHDGFVLNGHFAFYSCLLRIYYCDQFKKTKKNADTIQKLLSFMEQWVEGKNIDHQIQYKLAVLVWNKVQGNTVEDTIKEISDLVLKTLNKPLRVTVYKVLVDYYKNIKEVKEVYQQKLYKDLCSWGAPYISSMYKYVVSTKKEEIPKLEAVKEYANMSDFEVTKYYIDYLRYATGISDIGLCFEKNENLFLKYQFGTENIEHDSLNISMAKGISQKVLRYVFRSGETYYQDGLLCLPLKENEVLSGVIYMTLGDNTKYEMVQDVVRTYLPIQTSKNGRTAKLSEKLTNREIEIIQLVSEGKSNDAIGKILYVTIGTVRNHLSNAYKKMNVSNRVQAIIVAKELGIIN